MIAMLEFCCNLFYIIFLGLISKKTTFGTLITVMCTYLVILPYFFLMNTPHNKNRIVDVGWKNVLRNIFRGTTTSIEVEHSTSEGNRCVNSNVESHNKIANQTRKKVIHKKRNTQVEQNGRNIYIVPTLENDIATNSNSIDSIAKCPGDEEPTTSSGLRSQKKPQVEQVDEFEESEESITVNTEYDVQTITSILKESLEDENRYLRYFKRFLDLETYRKQKSIPSELSIEDLLRYDTLTRNGYSHSKEKIKHSNNVMLPKAKNACANVDTNEHDFVYRTLNGTKRNRNFLREVILSQLEICHPTEDKYESLIDELINLEEYFIN